MNNVNPQPTARIDSAPPQPALLRKRAYRLVAVTLLAYLLGAYVLLPLFWTRYARRHPALEDVPGVPWTGEGTDGDPLDVAYVGTKAQVMQAMVAARW